MNYPYRDDELISGIHKCIRASDIPRSCFFAKMIKENIGVWRVKQYLFFIVLEETLSVSLYEEGMKLFLMDDDKIKDIDIYTFIYKFCNTPKKWDYEQGQKLMYKQMINDIKFKEKYIYSKFHYDPMNLYDNDFNKDTLRRFEEKVKESEISYNKKSNTHKKSYYYGFPELLYLLDRAVKNKDLDEVVQMAYLFYRNRKNFDFNLLEPFFNSSNDRLFKSMQKLNGGYAYIFNYIALFYSILEPLEDLYKEDVNKDYILEVERRINLAIKEKRFIEIPVMALDEHTRRGKNEFAFLNVEYNKKLNLPADLRYSGLWYGIIWRIASVRQFGRVVDKWEDVKMTEYDEYLWKHLSFSRSQFASIKKENKKYYDYEEKYTKGDILDIEDGIIVHQVNCQNVMESGLAKKIKDKYPRVYTDYKEEFKNLFDKTILLGKVIYTEYKDLIIASTFTQYTYGRKGCHTNYEALKDALKALNDYSKSVGKTIYFPYNYACGLAGGNWDTVNKYIQDFIEDYKIIKF